MDVNEVKMTSDVMKMPLSPNVLRGLARILNNENSAKTLINIAEYVEFWYNWYQQCATSISMGEKAKGAIKMELLTSIASEFNIPIIRKNQKVWFFSDQGRKILL